MLGEIPFHLGSLGKRARFCAPSLRVRFCRLRELSIRRYLPRRVEPDCGRSLRPTPSRRIHEVDMRAKLDGVNTSKSLRRSSQDESTLSSPFSWSQHRCLGGVSSGPSRVGSEVCDAKKDCDQRSASQGPVKHGYDDQAEGCP